MLPDQSDTYSSCLGWQWLYSLGQVGSQIRYQNYTDSGVWNITKFPTPFLVYVGTYKIARNIGWGWATSDVKTSLKILSLISNFILSFSLFTLFSHAINEYLVTVFGGDNNPLFPKDPKVKAIINQRNHFDSGTAFPTFAAMSVSITLSIFFYLVVIYVSTTTLTWVLPLLRVECKVINFSCKNFLEIL